MRTYLIIFLISLLAAPSCNQKPDGDQAASAREAKNSPEANPVNDAQKIVPGKKIGNLYLEQNVAELDSLLGKPDFSDSAMGKSILTWYTDTTDFQGINQHYELSVFTSYKDSSMMAKSVKSIRTTSPEFATQKAICAGNNLQTIQSEFPAISPVGKYYDEKLKKDVVLYDAVDQGISFEIMELNGERRCIGIIIHQSRVKVTNSYLAFHPNIKSL